MKAYDLLAQRQAGDDVPTPRSGGDRGPLLSEAHRFWQEGSPARGGKTLSPSARTEAERAVRYFTQWHGDMRLGDITRERAGDFRDAIARMPIRLTAKERALPLRVLLERDHKGRDTMHVGSVNKYLNLLSAVISAAEKDGRMDKVPVFANPFTRLGLPLDRRSIEGGRRKLHRGGASGVVQDGGLYGRRSARWGSRRGCVLVPARRPSVRREAQRDRPAPSHGHPRGPRHGHLVHRHRDRGRQGHQDRWVPPEGPASR